MDISMLKYKYFAIDVYFTYYNVEISQINIY